MSTRHTKSTRSLLSPTIPKKIGTMSIPFPFYSVGPMLENNWQALPNATSSVIFKMLRKADEAEILPSPTAESNRKLPECARRSLMSMISWGKEDTNVHPITC